MIIYKITNMKTDKAYIGQTTQSLKERWWQHCNRAPSQKHRSYIYNAIKAEGPDNFKLEILATVDNIDSLNELEIFFISKHNTLAPNGYNLHLGGKSKICHPDTKKKISETLKGRPIKNRMNGAPKGRPVSEERKRRISNTMTGVAQPWKYKAVLMVETEIQYESIQAASKALDCSRTTIHKYLKVGKMIYVSNQDTSNE